MKGNWPIQYVRNPNIQKPIEKIWDDLDGFTFEYFEDNGDLNKIDLFIPIPPLSYRGKFTKGLLMTQASEYLLKQYPDLRKLFFIGAYSMCSAYPWWDGADVYFVCYENKAREIHHKNKYRKKKDIICLPLQDADYTDEYSIMPAYNIERDYDIICVATPYDVKNHCITAQAIKIYEQKYNKVLKCKFVFGLKEIKRNKRGDIDFSELHPNSQKIIEQMNEILNHNLSKYIDIIPSVPYNELPREYSSAKCLVLSSLLEGKNRALSEAMCCDTPIVIFKDFNKWARMGYPVFYGNSGEYAEEFTPESLADAIHKVITNTEKYEPRKNYLKHNGRKNFVNICAKNIPYYKENIPEFEDENFVDNIWVNLACQRNYQKSFHDFIYDKEGTFNWVRGIDNIDYLIKYYYFLFGIEHEQ